LCGNKPNAGKRQFGENCGARARVHIEYWLDLYEFFFEFVEGADFKKIKLIIIKNGTERNETKKTVNFQKRNETKLQGEETKRSGKSKETKRNVMK
jgi:hypothetical protein